MHVETTRRSKGKESKVKQENEAQNQKVLKIENSNVAMGDDVL